MDNMIITQTFTMLRWQIVLPISTRRLFWYAVLLCVSVLHTILPMVTLL